MTSAALALPVVATYGAADPSAPLVVLLHGRGSDERDIIGLAAHLPTGRRTRRSAPRSLRAPGSRGSPTVASVARSPSRCGRR